MIRPTASMLKNAARRGRNPTPTPDGRTRPARRSPWRWGITALVAAVLLSAGCSDPPPTKHPSADIAMEALQVGGLPQLQAEHVKWARKDGQSDYTYIVVAEIPSNTMHSFLETSDFDLSLMHDAYENDPIPKDGGIVTPDLKWITQRYLPSFADAPFREIKDSRNADYRLIDITCRSKTCAIVLVLTT